MRRIPSQAAPAAVVALGLALVIVNAIANSSPGPAVGVGAAAGPVVLLLLLARVGGSSSQSPVVLVLMLFISLAVGGAWGALVVTRPLPDPVTAAALIVLPVVLGALTLLVARRLGLIDEAWDVLAYASVTAFGWAGGFSSVILGAAIRVGDLDTADPATLATIILPDTVLTPLIAMSATVAVGLVVGAARRARGTVWRVGIILVAAVLGMWLPLWLVPGPATVSLVVIAVAVCALCASALSGATVAAPPADDHGGGDVEQQ